MPRNWRIQLTVMAAILANYQIATAHTFCVDNAADLQDALTSASINGPYANEDNIIQIVVGTYGTGAATMHQAFTYGSVAQHSLTILGGYNAGCHARTANATATVIDGENQTGAMALDNLHGDISVEDLTFQHGNTVNSGAGLDINFCSNPPCAGPQGNRISVMHSVMRNNTTTSNQCGGGLVAYADALVYVAHNLIEDNTAGSPAGGGVCLATATGATQFYGNTVVENNAGSGANAAGGLACGGPAPCEIYDNIFWDNSGAGLLLTDPGAVLLFNDFGARVGQDPSIEVGDVSENPQFVDLAAGNVHLSGASPLLGLSYILLNGVDLQGNPYPTGGFQDIGALEETIFVDGFDAQ